MPPRRSKRQHIPSKKYKNDSFEDLDVLSSDSDRNALLRSRLLQSKQDGDDLQDFQQVEPDEPDDHEILEGSNDEDDEAQSAIGLTAAEAKSSRGVLTRPKGKSGQPAVRSRGLPDTYVSKSGGLDFFSGPDKKDALHITKAQVQWGRDPILPKRSKLSHIHSHTKEQREMEATVGWDWYYDQGGRDFFSKRQKVQPLLPEDGVEYIPRPVSDTTDFLMGPYGLQKLFSLPSLQSLNVDKAWNSAIKEHYPEDQRDSSKPERHGWMLNVGIRVGCLDWATNQDDGLQYLAIATRRPRPRGPAKEAPSFTPAAPTPSAIQIWAFATKETANTESRMDSTRQPELQQVLCTDWGDIKQLKWCPIPRTFRDEKARGNIPLGLLAGIWDDGYARVLEVQLDMEHTTLTKYLKIHTAAFTARPSNTLSTCLTWLSPTDLAVGHSNGTLNIYNIHPPTSTSTSPPTPWLTHPLHPTTILSLCHLYPTHPTLLTSTSLSGTTRLLSLTHPETETTLSKRSTLPPLTLCFHPGLNAIIHPDENREILSAHSLRYWSSGVAFANMAGSGGVGAGCLDVGDVHGRVVWGGRDGGVYVGNAGGQGRVIGVRGRQGGQVRVFALEWVRGGGGGGDGIGEGGEGMARVLESFAPEKVELEFGRGRGGVPFTTVYEEESGVCAVAWGRGVRCGSWLGVGWGCGLVRVQDVGV